MFGDVVDGFFDGEENVVTDLSAEMQRRKMRRNVEAATDARDAEMFLGEFDSVGQEIFEGVVLRVNRPNDFIHGASEFARGAGNLADVRLGLRGTIEVGAGEFAEQRDLRQAGAEVVVNIFGDAGAFAFDGVLLFEQFHTAMQFFDFNHANGSSDAAADHQHARGKEPPCLPKSGNDTNGEDAAGLVPDAVVVGGDHLETIVAGREMRIVRGAARAGVLPIFVQPVEAITEANFFGRAKAQAGVAELNLGAIGRNGEDGGRGIERVGDAIDFRFFDSHFGRLGVDGNVAWIHNGDAFDGWEHETAIARFANGGLKAAGAFARGQAIAFREDRKIEVLFGAGFSRHELFFFNSKNAAIGTHP